MAATASRTQDFRTYLREELVRRCKANPRYSLRAYAKFLQVEPSYLSKILRGQRSLTPARITRFSARLGLSPHQRDHLLKATMLGPIEENPEYNPLNYETFQIIADWYHYAILELVNVRDFESSPKWISRALGISEAESQLALERLLGLGFLAQDANGRLVNASGNHTTISAADTASALRARQKQILALATDALDNVPIEKRDQSAMTLSIPLRLLPEARERVKNFRRELAKFLQESLPHDEVYELSISLFPLSKATELKPRRSP